MNLDRFKNIIRSYLDGKLSAQEKDRLDGWYDSITQTDIKPFKNVNHKNRIKEDILSGIPAHIYHTKRGPSLRRSLLVAASVMLVGTMGSLFLLREQVPFFYATSTNPAFEYISTQAGEIKEFILPDRSSIWLSGNAKFRFDREGYAVDRKIYLDQGEVFFDIQRDSLHPFTVEMERLSIQVLGTSFNVKHSKEYNQITINVKTGKIEVSDQQGSLQHILTKGKSLQYDIQNGVLQLFASEPTNANLWTKGGVFLANAAFGELQELLYDRYGLSLRSDGLDTDTFRYSILMPHVRSVEDLLNMICNIHQIKYRRKNDEIILYK